MWEGEEKYQALTCIRPFEMSLLSSPREVVQDSGRVHRLHTYHRAMRYYYKCLGASKGQARAVTGLASDSNASQITLVIGRDNLKNIIPLWYF